MDILNLLLFVPLGFLLVSTVKLISWNFIKVLLTGLFISFVIEFLQLFTGRMSEISDLIMNTVGFLLGGLVCILIKRVFSSRFFNAQED